MIIKYEVQGKEMAYVDYSIDSEDIYDDEGDVVDEVEYWHIENIYTDPSLRGKGIARRLMEAAIEDMRERDPEKIIKIVACPRDDETELDELCEFYRSLGFYADESSAESPWPIMEMY